eukprot:gene5184-7028_t
MLQDYVELSVVAEDLGLNFKNWISNKLKAQNISVTKPHGRSMRQDMALPWFEFYLEMLDRTAWEKMAGPGMEIFRMTFYVFLPIGMFYYFGLPNFYENQVLPAFTVPTTPEGNRKLLEKLAAHRRAEKDSSKEDSQ